MKRSKPLKRSIKPIRRTWLKKRLGRKGKATSEAMKAAKAIYFESGTIQPCQQCGVSMNMEMCHIHHKIKRSLGGKDDFSNLVAIHNYCHALIHAAPEELKKVRESSANILNREIIIK